MLAALRGKPSVFNGGQFSLGGVVGSNNPFKGTRRPLAVLEFRFYQGSVASFRFCWRRAPYRNVRYYCERLAMRIWFFAFIAALSFSVAAQDFNNGCGSGWNEPIVPDRIGSLCVDFRASCANHDNCYSKCLEGGENYGKPICNQTEKEQKEGRRAICDTTFLSNMSDACSACDPARRLVCRGVAAIYEIAVQNAGGGSFNGIEVPDSYYDFIASDAAKDFDFSAFVKDVKDIRSIKEISLNNKLTIAIEEKRPIAKFSRINPIETVKPIKFGNVYQVDTLRYGSVDLSSATNGEKPLTLKNIDLNKIDLQRLKNEQRFSTNKP